MNTEVSFYDLASGDLTGRTYSGPEHHLVIPEGQGVVPGRHDHIRCQVGHCDDGFGNTTPTVVSCLPTKPDDTPSMGWEWSISGDCWVGVPTLYGAQKSRWEEAKEARDLASVAPITVNDHTYDADQSSTFKILGTVVRAMYAQASGNTEWQEEWTFSDNTKAWLPAAEIVEVGMAIGDRTSAIHRASREVHDQIFACTSIPQVATISWSFPP